MNRSKLTRWIYDTDDRLRVSAKKVWAWLLNTREPLREVAGDIQELWRGPEEDIEFLPEIDMAAKETGSQFAYVLTACVMVILLFLWIWASFAKLDEVTRGEAKVISSLRTQVIQNLEGGILSEILAHEGEIVEEGQVLVRIDNTIAETTYRDARQQYIGHLAAIARLEAEIGGFEPVFSNDLVAESPDSIKDQMGLFEARQRQVSSQEGILAAQVEQRSQEINELHSRQRLLEGRLKLSVEQRDIAAPLAKQGVYPRVDFLKLESEVLSIEGELDALTYSIPRAESAHLEAGQRLEEHRSSFAAKASEELQQRRQEVQSLQETIIAGADRVTRTEVRAPMRGTVKQIIQNTLGGIIKPGDDILEIVPLEDTLLIEARIRPADIAFIRPRQAAMVKITAYDFSIYGGLNAEVEQISADTIRDEKGESFYRVTLRTKESRLTRNGADLPIIPGMTASVDVLTGQKSVLDYLLKPVRKTMENAMNER